MSDISLVQKELEKVGLSTNQAKIYLLLIAHKELRVQEIVRLADIPRSSVYESLKKLFELGIAEEIVEDTFKKIRPYSLGIMTHGLEEEMTRLQKIKSDLHDLEKTLKLTTLSGSQDATTVRYYKDRSGARQLFWNSLKAEDMVYVYSDWSRRRYVGMKYYEYFVTETRKRHIKEHVLINMSPDTLTSIRKHSYPGSPISRTRVEDIRVLDNEKMLIKGDTVIYDNIYAHVYLKNVTINGFEIENNQFTEMQRSIFETLWNMAIPVSQFL
jgi:sugar-specific transcriptional regulator TrmB